MYIYEDADVVVKPSPIDGLGVFAERMFREGETVLTWHPTRLSSDEVEALSKEKRRYLEKLSDGTMALMNIPERYVNSSKTPNTKVQNDCDVALRDIDAGEEITSAYEF